MTPPAFAAADAGPDAVLDALLEGNRRWAGGAPATGASAVRFPLHDHRPAAAVLACADARVPVELIFDQPAGGLFVVRLAGNPATPEAEASLRFAVEGLGVPLVVVLGHEPCGAMAAAVRAVAGREDPGALAPITERLSPAISSLEGPVVPSDPASERRAVEAHARRTAAALAASLDVSTAAGVYRGTDGVVGLVPER